MHLLCLYFCHVDDGPVRIEYAKSDGTPFHSGFLDLTAPPYSIRDYYTATGQVFFVPKTTGLHRFYGCGDDNLKIYVSTDQSPDNKIKVVDKNQPCS